MAEQQRKKKLIETGIPLRIINEESAREKSLRHGLPSTLHLYWARRPLATTRSILFAQLVDDPSAHPDRFPTEQEQAQERQRLQLLMGRLARWENTSDSALYQDARQAILDSNDGVMPSVLDPFAGGGAIPLEAQRLGCQAQASDLNPLAVIINQALIEYPARFAGRPAIHPTESAVSTDKAQGLAEDIRYYGAQLRDLAFAKVGDLYPQVIDEQGQAHTVIAWIWARTVTNPNPANPIQVPLVRSWWLSKKKGHEAWVKPVVEPDGIRYEVQHNADGPTGVAEGTIGRNNGYSIVDGTAISKEYIQEEASAGRIGEHLIAIVIEGLRKRTYISPDSESMYFTTRLESHKIREIRENSILNTECLGTFASNARGRRYSFNVFGDYFTDRQLIVLSALCDGVGILRQRVLHDALAAGMAEGLPLDEGGSGAVAYADAVAVYLALAVSRQTDRCSSINGWDSSRDTIRNVFARQAIPMTWDYAESNPFSTKSGNFLGQVEWVAEAVDHVPAYPQSWAEQADAATRSYGNVVISTDPPYYDNIDYSDLSDYFYVWLHRMLHSIVPSVARTTLTPKAQELVANPYRHNGKEGAAKFFIEGFNQVFSHIRESANDAVPMTVYYAYKQKNDKTGTSTGWHALLDGLIGAGWEITATWPVRSELSNRMISSGTNSLSSSIVLSCRPRPVDAPSIPLRRFSGILHDELSRQLVTIMAAGIDPVDLAQAAIGPGISVYSRYSRVRKADGSDMPVQEALEIINRTLDEVLGNADTDYDPDTRFAIRWYQSYGWGTESSGTADQLSRSTGTTPGMLVAGGIFLASGGKARLLPPRELSEIWKPLQDDHTSLWEAAVRMAGILDQHGVDAVVPVMAEIGERMPLDQVKSLGFRLYHEAEKRKDTEGALLFNALVSMWEDLSGKARHQTVGRHENVQGELEVD